MATELKITSLYTPYNYTSGNINRIKYIVIHYVGALGGAKENCQYYASTYVGASAHYYVGFNGEIYQSVRDKDVAWSVGASSYVHKECRNSNSLNIEMCVRKKSTKTMNATDKDWYFEEATVKSAIALTQYLMKKYNIAADHVIRHYDVTGKICPNPYVYNNTKYTWQAFKSAIGGQADVQVTQPTVTFNKTGEATCTGQDVRVREVANGPIIEYLDKGQALEIDGTTNGNWTHVRVPATGSVGWVSSDYVQIKVVNPAPAPSQPTTTEVTYRVGTGWKNGKCENQHNAFSKLENAKNDANDAMNEFKKTYNVYDDNGKVVYTATYTAPSQPAQTQPKPEQSGTFSSLVRDSQIHINNFSGSGLELTGILDSATKKGLIKSLKVALNHDHACSLVINGKKGDALKKALGNYYVTADGQRSYLATFVQIALMAHGYEHDGVACPGIISGAQMTCIKKYQKDHNLTADGMAGKNTLWSMIQ